MKRKVTKKPKIHIILERPDGRKTYWEAYNSSETGYILIDLVHDEIKLNYFPKGSYDEKGNEKKSD